MSNRTHWMPMFIPNFYILPDAMWLESWGGRYMVIFLFDSLGGPNGLATEVDDSPRLAKS